jgi:hypothetical protein
MTKKQGNINTTYEQGNINWFATDACAIS